VKKTIITLVFLLFTLISCTRNKPQNIVQTDNNTDTDEYLHIGGLFYNYKLSELSKINHIRLILHPHSDEASNSFEGIELLENLEKLSITGINYPISEDSSWTGADISGIDFSPLKSLKKLKQINFFYTTLNEIPDLSGIISLKEFQVYCCTIISLKGIEKAKQIKQLDINFANDYFSDFTIISYLKELEKLDISTSYQGRKEWEKYTFHLADLSGLTGLKSLCIGHYSSIDLAGIHNLSNLEYLSISESNMINIQEIAYLRNLQRIHSLSVPVTSLVFLASLTKMIDLRLDGNGNTIDIEPLINMVNLEELGLINFTITNFQVLDDLPKLELVITHGSNFFPEDNNKLKHARVSYEQEPR
jgi:internalin A